jgi:hypothetical protein
LVLTCLHIRRPELPGGIKQQLAVREPRVVADDPRSRRHVVLHSCWLQRILECCQPHKNDGQAKGVALCKGFMRRCHQRTQQGIRLSSANKGSASKSLLPCNPA